MISDKAKALSSKGHIERSLNTGVKGESMFEDALKRNGISFTKATESQNMKEHIDYFVWGVPVDVKGLKKAHESGFFPIEFKNVQGKAGWCSEGSKAELIAFQTPDCFVIVRKDEMLEYCRKNVRKEYAQNFTEAYLKLYTRKGRKDLMTKISTEDINKFKFAIILK